MHGFPGGDTLVVLVDDVPSRRRRPRAEFGAFRAGSLPLGDGAWSLRVQVKPLIRFIWLGALIMAFGGLLAITDPRYRAQRAQEKVQLSAQSVKTV